MPINSTIWPDRENILARDAIAKVSIDGEQARRKNKKVLVHGGTGSERVEQKGVDCV